MAIDVNPVYYYGVLIIQAIDSYIYSITMSIYKLLSCTGMHYTEFLIPFMIVCDVLVYRNGYNRIMC